MTRPLISILAACVTAAGSISAGAASNKVEVPDQYDGSWTITAVTKDGPCAVSTSYQVQIKDGSASIPAEGVDIDGGVSTSGAVQATITKGSNKVPITGSLDPKGSGSGTWHAGGLIACGGSWSAKRTG